MFSINRCCILLSCLIILITSCAKDSSCDAFENIDDIELRQMPVVGCVEGRRVTNFVAIYKGATPNDYSWEWRIDTFRGNDKNIIVIGNKKMDGYIKYKNEVTGCYIFKNIELEPGEPSCSIVGNQIWREDHYSNKLNEYDNNDYPMPNIKVDLLNSSNQNIIEGVVSDHNGQYSFTKLPEGEYILKFHKPDEYKFVSKWLGSESSVDSDVNTDGYTDPFYLDGCKDVILTIDAGLTLK